MPYNDRFYPTPLNELLQIVLNQLDNGEVLGLPNELFFYPQKSDFFKFKYINSQLDSPVGVAAGPQTQLAQNIVVSWLAGARFIELKTVQILDEIEVSKPCIDMQDEGYNCEWSQELKIHQAFDEYLNAWIIIHILQDKLGFENFGTAFNMSVGYDLQGIMKPNVQWFLDKMTDASKELSAKIAEIEKIYPNVKNLNIPVQITDNITLSTMHGCPPEEIEQIAKYLISERKINTIIKLNPTLLGKDFLKEIIVNSGFKTNVPDIAFDHDLKYSDAKPMIERLLLLAEQNNVFFGIKLTNTLESKNNKNVFGSHNDMMYMSGKALHPISINLSKKIQSDFEGKLTISFSGGADAFNIADIVSTGLKPITISSDLLKPGGYGRLHQYYDNLRAASENANSIDDYINKKAKKQQTAKLNALYNLKNYADKVLISSLYKRASYTTPSIKTDRKLNIFDCIAAPCQTTCPTNQNVPQYMYQVQTGDLQGAMCTVFEDNPFPNVTGYVCDHTCQQKCTRINYDNSLNIREIKRYIAGNDISSAVVALTKQKSTTKVAIIGAGPGGLSAAYYLITNGFDVEIFEKKSRAGGMVANAIPSFRLPDEQVEIDVNRIQNMGVKIIFEFEVNSKNFDEIKSNFNFIFVAPGAQAALKVNLPGSDAVGVLDPLEFFFKTRRNNDLNIGKRVAIIGGGNTAMDAARIAKRLIPNDGEVVVLYRRTKEQMPAHYIEIVDAEQEGVKFMELVEPDEFVAESGVLKAVKLVKTELVADEKGGRPKPVRINGSEFELPFDTVIAAVGQLNDFDFLKEREYKKQTIPFTQYKNIFVGGDAVRGAASAIKAIADGKNTAFEIIKTLNPEFVPEKSVSDKKISYKDLKIKKAKREFGQPPNELPLSDRNNFKLVSETYTDEQAKTEADRCLLCDELCDVCVSVCPNLANQGYEIEPFSAEIPKIQIIGQRRSIVTDKVFEVKQTRQTYNIADWCNECGNCATFCPTSGKPYLDKPKVHLSKKSFTQSPHGFFVTKLAESISVEYKDGFNKFKLLVDDDGIVYESAEVKALFDFNFQILEFEVKSAVEEIKFNYIAEMFLISKI
ncbi:MAG: putative selenate reductase subunit YgfK [Bacteroidales bacterium]|nr:putative selenate reductase subunit YgfK [Bacteroidales bacterium]